MVLLLIDGLRASWMMSEQMVLWEHKRTAATPYRSTFKSWKKQGKLIVYHSNVFLFSKTFSFCLSLLSLPRPLLCPDRVHTEILVSPPLHPPHPWKHQSWMLLQPRRSQLCDPRSEICSKHRWCFHFIFWFKQYYFFQLTTSSSMRLSSRSIGQLATA